MLGVSFKNPNYDHVINGKVQFVENELEILSTDKDYCIIKYSGFKFGNAVITIGSYRIDDKATALLPTEELCNLNAMFKKGTLEKYEYRGLLFNKTDEYSFDVTKTPRGYQVGITNAGPTIVMNFSNDRFKYLMDRWILGYYQFLAAELVNKGTLKESDKNIHDEYKLLVDEMLYLGNYPNQYPYTENKTIFETVDESESKLSLVMNSYGIKKTKFIFKKDDLELPYYLSFQDALLIAQDIKSEKYYKLFGKTGGKPYFEKIGGTISKSDKPVREDGQPEARIFKVLPGTTNESLVFVNSVGRGRITRNGGIEMDLIEKEIQFTLSKKAAKCLVAKINKSILAFLVAEFTKDVSKDGMQQSLGQITRCNARTTLVTSVSRAFNMKKIRFDFLEYDKQSHKQKKYVDFYLTEEMFYSLHEKVLSGELYKASKTEAKRVAEETQRTGKKQWAKPIFTCSAGTAPEAAGRSDGMALAKVFNVLPSDTADFALQGVSGCGIQDEDKKIKIKKPETSIFVAMNGDDLKRFVLITMIHWRAFKIAQNIALEKEQLLYSQGNSNSSQAV